MFTPDPPVLECPECGRDVDIEGDALFENCCYCADKCETCGGGDCDQSC